MSIVPSPPANATPTARGLMSAADKAKLDGIPPGGGSSVVTSVTQANGLTLTAGDLAMGAASAAAPGAVTTGAQEFAGAKTLTGAILTGITTIAEAVTSLVRAVGASLVLRSSLGAGASDVAVRVGTSETDAGTNTIAKLLSVRTGLGGTEVESLSVRKNGVIQGGAAQCVLNDGSYGAYLGWSSFAYFTAKTNAEMVGQAATVTATANTAVVRSALGAGASDVATKAGSSAADASVASTAKLWGAYTGLGGTEVEKAFIAKNGTVELTGAGVGIVLRSPDGTRWRLTVANGGTLSITAA